MGLYGSKSSAPRISAEEFAEKVGVMVGEGEGAVRIRRRARELEVLCGGREGRIVAAERILEAVKGEKVG